MYLFDTLSAAVDELEEDLDLVEEAAQQVRK